MKLKLTAAALVCAASTFVAPAVQARPLADVYTQCGIGAMLFADTSWAAVTSNILWDWGTTAISSDLSSADNCKGGQAKTAAFIFHSYAQLEQDLARGEGEHLDALMATAGCAAPAQGQVKTALRSQLATRVASPDYAQATRLDNARALLDTLNAQAAGTCTI
ncbi:DUF3015 family protein [Ideonella livida]|uniref:DUF3015 domain-containing protein n=1 Tax=Ideonella livida TaxID=2707176 RepID=A0A7C9TJQ5_9BURK|nr:DUF3015 family protein [Ideonella livida]NDY91918.1 DUF3015 domain-containing protein [Ideonella livida]